MQRDAPSIACGSREYSGRVLLSDVSSPPREVRTPAADDDRGVGSPLHRRRVSTVEGVLRHGVKAVRSQAVQLSFRAAPLLRRRTSRRSMATARAEPVRRGESRPSRRTKIAVGRRRATAGDTAPRAGHRPPPPRAPGPRPRVTAPPSMGHRPEKTVPMLDISGTIGFYELRNPQKTRFWRFHWYTLACRTREMREPAK